ncbi:MAG: DNA-3-methyladenine glycosylase 2 family protein [Oceanococcus sp.]
MQAQQHTLDPIACERARLARDPRFDGQFFITVSSTGIFCRTICPVRLPKPENVHFVPTAAAAMEQGYRPCLRCRPELAPDNPYWPQHPPLLRAALQYIDDGVLDHAGVDILAQRLGVSERHLRRLFQAHVGSTPNAMATHRRTLFAKRLISDTQLPFGQIAEASGFGSVRRFNAAISNLYGKAPRDLRRSSGVSSGSLTVMLKYRQPYAWTAMREFLRTRAIVGVESVSEDSCSRNIEWQGSAGKLLLRHCPEQTSFELQLQHPKISAALTVVQAARHMLDLDASPQDIHAVLAKDPALTRTLKEHPGLRVPGSWNRFELCVRAVIGQQVSVKGARTLTQRVVERCDHRMDNADLLLFPGPQQILDHSLSGLGLTGRRIDTLKATAEAILSGALPLNSRDLSAVDQALSEIHGIGPWTRSYIALRALKDPDALPDGDIVLRKAISLDGKAVSPAQLQQHSKIWQPWRAYAVMTLWLQSAHQSERKKA